jgi:hypothetical protein
MERGYMEKWERERERWLISKQDLERLLRYLPDDGGSKNLWNVGKLYQTARRYNPEDRQLHARRRENLKSRLDLLCSGFRL